MRRIIFSVFLGLMTLSSYSQQVMTKDASTKTFTVNTTTIGEGIRGYAGPVPLNVTIKQDKIVSVEILVNKETPGYLKKIQKELIPLYVGKRVKDILVAQPDGVTGATMSSNAIKENVRLALEYYKKNKRAK